MSCGRRNGVREVAGVVEVESELMIAEYIKPEVPIACKGGERPEVPAK